MANSASQRSSSISTATLPISGGSRYLADLNGKKFTDTRQATTTARRELPALSRAHRQGLTSNNQVRGLRAADTGSVKLNDQEVRNAVYPREVQRSPAEVSPAIKPSGRSSVSPGLPRRRTALTIGSVRPSSSPASASCNLRIGTCRSLLKRFFEKSDELPKCAERSAGALAAVVRFLFELFPGFA